MKGALFVGGLPLATNAERPLTLHLDVQPPQFEASGAALFDEARSWYGEHARRFVDALLAHAPGGFADAVLGELLYRKSTIFRVTLEDRP
jgi:hypothetical protein